MTVDMRIFLIGGGNVVRGTDGRFVRRATADDMHGAWQGIAPAPAHKASAAFLAASAAHRNRRALVARVQAKAAPDKSLLRKVRVRAGDLYQNPNLGKRDAWGHTSVMDRTRNTERTRAWQARILPS
jgi:hypothetical protein